MAKVFLRLATYHSMFLGLALFFSFLSVAVQVSPNATELVWQDRPFVALGCLVFGVSCAALYVFVFKNSNNLLKQKVHQFESQLSELDIDKITKTLTPRQKEVFDLIITGDSNKEIAAKLFIEQSTLKTHINLLYKKLGVANRRALIYRYSS